MLLYLSALVSPFWENYIYSLDLEYDPLGYAQDLGEGVFFPIQTCQPTDIIYVHESECSLDKLLNTIL